MDTHPFAHPRNHPIRYLPILPSKQSSIHHSPIQPTIYLLIYLPISSSVHPSTHPQTNPSSTASTPAPIDILAPSPCCPREHPAPDGGLALQLQAAATGWSSGLGPGLELPGRLCIGSCCHTLEVRTLVCVWTWAGMALGPAAPCPALVPGAFRRFPLGAHWPSGSPKKLKREGRRGWGGGAWPGLAVARV